MKLLDSASSIGTRQASNGGSIRNKISVSEKEVNAQTDLPMAVHGQCFLVSIWEILPLPDHKVFSYAIFIFDLPNYPDMISVYDVM